jgi:hypothetical protein
MALLCYSLASQGHAEWGREWTRLLWDLGT